MPEKPDNEIRSFDSCRRRRFVSFLSHPRIGLPRVAPMFAMLALAAQIFVPTVASAEARATEIAGQVLEAMGGEEAWEETRYIRFDFFGFRLHHWDRYTGRHRFEGETSEGVGYVVLHNIQSREGRVYLDGEEQAGEAKQKWLERAYGAWVNDTYWLLMPYKLRDPGVELSHDGEEELNGVMYDKLLLTFEGVGLTPGDRYWAYINRETKLMDRWAYLLQDWEGGRSPAMWQWQDWETYGRIKLSSLRIDPENGRERTLGELAVFDELPDAVFDSPASVSTE